MLIFIPITILSLSFYLFLFWKRLKEDYSQDTIFDTVFSILGAFFLAIVFARFYFVDYWFWCGLSAAFAMMIIMIRKYRMKFFETLDALIIAFFPILLFFSIGKWLAGSAEYFFMAVIAALLIMFFFFIDARYKKFLWYKSGKIGFSGLITASIFFVTVASIAILAPGMVFLSGLFDAGLAILLSLTCLYSLFKLSKRA